MVIVEGEADPRVVRPPVWRQVVDAGGARMVSLTASLVILVISARTLGEAGRGEFATALAWALLGSSVLYLSMGQVALHEAVGRGTDRAWRASVLGTLAVFAAGLGALGWVGAALAWLATGGDAFAPLEASVLAVGLLMLPLLIWEQYGSALLAMAGRVDVYNRAQVVGRGIAVLVIAGLLAVGAGVHGLLAGWLVGQAWVATAGSRFLLREGGCSWPSREVAGRLVSGGLRLHAGAVATVCITSVDVLIVAHYLGSADAGSYQLALQLVYALTVLPQAATLVVYGSLVRGGPQSAWETQRRIAAMTLTVVAVLSLAAVIAAPLVIEVVAGAGFEDSVSVFRVVVASSLGFALSALMAPQWIGRGLFGLSSALTVGVAALNVTANLVFVPRYGLDAAAVVVLATSGLMLLVNGAFAVYCERERGSLR